MFFDSGVVLHLTDLTSGHSTNLLLEKKGKGSISLARPSQPYHRLSVLQSGEVEFRIGSDKFCLWRFISASESQKDHFFVQSCLSALFLKFDENSKVFQSMTTEPVAFRIQVVDSTTEILTSCSFTERKSFEFSSWQLQRMLLEGYLVLPQHLPLHKVTSCLRVLNQHMGVPGALVKGGTQGVDVGKFEGGVTTCFEMRQLFLGEVCAAVDSLMGGVDSCDIHALSAQIAFRFPENSFGQSSSSSSATCPAISGTRK